MVPRGDVDRYNAALLEGGGLPDDWAAELEKQYEKRGWFPSDRQTKDRKQIALIRELRRIIRALPDIEDASVVWAPSKPKRFSGRSPKVTATVNVKPRSGREVTPRLASSLRLAVANMIPDLSPENVTIFNMRTYESYTIEKDTPFDGRLISWIKTHTKRYKEKIEEQLSYIPGAIVAVDVQIENLESHVEETKNYQQPGKGSVTIIDQNKTRNDSSTTQAPVSPPGVEPNRPRALTSNTGPAKSRKSELTDKSSTTIPGYTASLKRYLAAMPKAVKVSVGIPEEYFAKVAEKTKAAGGTGGNAGQAAGPTRDQILADIKQMVSRTIGADPAGDAVEVRPFIRVDQDVPSMETPFIETAMTAAGRWGGPLALGLFAFWALWMVKKNMPTLSASQSDPIAALAVPVPASVEESQPEERPAPQPTARDKLQTVVRDNPEVAAAVINQWLRSA
jgi:flagellar M-ring protein FliF